MGFAAGTRLGPYEIESPLGAGGMGEVYRGRDTRLDRTVAIKVLHSSLASSPDLKARFEREARAISALQHPNICVLYDVGCQDGTDFLVMEFLEGQPLSERLRSGPLPTDQLLKIALEIANALEKAHRAGIIHRDLKPGNIMLTKGGAKLLDFGLAKPLAASAATAGSGSGSSASVFAAAMTMSSPASPLTSAGSIVGTVQYMSPEQIHGAEADARSDIFAFGVLLFEMATGKRAFEGKTQSAVVGSILANDPPPVSTLRPAVPPALDRLVRNCLDKDPDERFQSVHDLKLHLQAIAETPADAPASAAGPSKGVSRWIWITTAAALLVAMAAAMYFASVALEPKPVVHAYILPPDKAQFSTVSGSGAGAPAISPDGTRLAFIARAAQGKPMLYVQALSSATAQPLAGTEDAAHPFWSPDSRWIGFFIGNQVKKIEASGGPAQTLCEAPSNNERGGSWSADGTILFGFGSPVSPLLRVSAAGGACLPALKFEPDEVTHRWPQWLPDGKHFLFYADSRKLDQSGIYVGTLDSGQHKLILRTNIHAQYAAGYLLFLRDQTLMAQPFSMRGLALSGEAVPVAEHVAASLAIHRALFSSSENGMLVYQTGAGAASGWNLQWYDREGKQVGSVGGVEPFRWPAISPDGTRVAAVLATGAQPDADVWIFDLGRGTKTRLTFGPGRAQNPLWTPDGKYVVYSSNRNGRLVILRKAADNSGPEEVVLADDADNLATSVSHDGRYLVYQRSEPKTTKTDIDIFILPLFGDRKPFPIVQTQFTEGQGAISPDGKWLAYINNQSGNYEIFVTAFPGGGTKSQVSLAGGYAPAWRSDGRELYYKTDDNRLMAVEVSSSGGTIQLGTPKQILQVNMVASTNGPFAVLDGKKFLINMIGGSSDGVGDPFTLITNWPALLKK